MTDEEHTRLQALWQSLPAPGITMSADAMRARARALERAVRGRNWREYIASVGVIAAFGWYATWPEPATPLWPIANMTIILGVLVTLWNMRRVSARRPPPAAPSATLAEFHRAELVRQKEGLRTVWLWYVGPSVPGFGLWFTALWIGTPEALQTGDRAFALVAAAGVYILVSAGVIAINLMAAARLQRLIDTIDGIRE